MSEAIGVDYDGEYTEVQKWGFGALNQRLGDGGQVGYHGISTSRFTEITYQRLIRLADQNPHLPKVAIHRRMVSLVRFSPFVR
jgi:hypothetical protein